MKTPYVVPLGVAAALTTLEHANSFLAVAREGRYWLVDCADNPIGRLQHAGLDPLAVQGIIITHLHPDHVYGLPAYLLGLVLLGFAEGHALERGVSIYALPEVLAGIRDLLAVFKNQKWLDTLPVSYHAIVPEEGVRVHEDADFSITAAPTCHGIPSLALRFMDRATGHACVYSSDTALCPAVERLAQNAALLFHEAIDGSPSHTPPAEVGALAARAAVERLVLMHYYPTPDIMQATLEAASETFGGPTELAREFQRYPW